MEHFLSSRWQEKDSSFFLDDGFHRIWKSQVRHHPNLWKNITALWHHAPPPSRSNSWISGLWDMDSETTIQGLGHFQSVYSKRVYHTFLWARFAIECYNRTRPIFFCTKHRLQAFVGRFRVLSISSPQECNAFTLYLTFLIPINGDSTWYLNGF